MANNLNSVEIRTSLHLMKNTEYHSIKQKGLGKKLRELKDCKEFRDNSIGEMYEFYAILIRNSGGFFNIKIRRNIHLCENSLDKSRLPEEVYLFPIMVDKEVALKKYDSLR